MKIKLAYLSLLFLIPFISVAQEMSVKLSAVKINFHADMHNTDGSISGFKAKIKFNTDDLTKSTISGSVDVNTLNTGNTKRDEHLKTSDFFDVEVYPTMTFTSQSFEKKGSKYYMTGIMKTKDVEREETIVFSYKDHLFVGETTIQASRYNIGDYAKKGPEKTNIKITFEIPVE